MKHLVKIIHHR